MYVLDCSRINLLANNGIIVIEGYIGYIYINFMEFFRSYLRSFNKISHHKIFHKISILHKI